MSIESLYRDLLENVCSEDEDNNIFYLLNDILISLANKLKLQYLVSSDIRDETASEQVLGCIQSNYFELYQMLKKEPKSLCDQETVIIEVLKILNLIKCWEDVNIDDDCLDDIQYDQYQQYLYLTRIPEEKR
jgi:hypothetical protein